MRYLAAKAPEGGVLALVGSLVKRHRTGALELETDKGREFLYFIDGQLYLRRSYDPSEARLAKHLARRNETKPGQLDDRLSKLLRLTGEHLSALRVRSYRFVEDRRIAADELLGPLPAAQLIEEATAEVTGQGERDDPSTAQAIEGPEATPPDSGARALASEEPTTGPEEVPPVGPLPSSDPLSEGADRAEKPPTTVGEAPSPPRAGWPAPDAHSPVAEPLSSEPELGVPEEAISDPLSPLPPDGAPAAAAAGELPSTRLDSRDEPAIPVEEPVVSNPEPAVPGVETADPSAEPAVSDAEPVVPVAESALQRVEPTVPVGESALPRVEPAVPTEPALPGAKTVIPASELAVSTPSTEVVADMAPRDERTLRAWYRHFGLRCQPFSLTPDPEFLFMSDSHAEALAGLKLSLLERRGLCVMTGEVGTGKTTLLYSLLSGLESNIETAYVNNPALPFNQLLEALLRDLDILPRSTRRIDQLTLLNDFLTESAAKGKTVAVVIDEAQNLSDQSFELLRMLLNFETYKSKLLQIVLVGQPELGERLRSRELRQIADRIAVRCRVEPLSKTESREYVRHRLKSAWGDEDLFTWRALGLVARKSKGIPRRINVTCHNAMLFAYAQGSRTVTRSLVAEALRDLKG